MSIASSRFIQSGADMTSFGALGMIETRGLLRLYEAVNIITKTATFERIGRINIPGGVHLLWFRGDLGGVNLAAEAVETSLRNVPEFITSSVIPMPHSAINLLLETDTRGAQLSSEQPMSVGCIETEGMVAALVSIDAVCKTADIRFLGLEFAGDSSVLVKFEGELASMQVAIESGIAAAGRISRKVTRGLLSRPLRECLDFVNQREDGAAPERMADVRSKRPPREIDRLPRRAEEQVTTVVEEPEMPRHKDAPVESKSGRTPIRKKTEESEEKTEVDQESPRRRNETLIDFSQHDYAERISLYAEYEQMPVWQLRKVARQTAGLSIFGRDISKANKIQLLEQLKSALKLS